MNKPVITVVAALVVDKQKRILITQRMADSHLAGMWEFPGGKILDGETETEALVRELKEELDLKICVENCFFHDVFEYDTKIIDIAFFWCKPLGGLQHIKPIEVADYRWVFAGELQDYRFPPADEQLIRELQKIARLNTFPEV